MEKIITLTLTEKKARMLFDNLVVLTRDLDDLYKKNNNPGTKENADLMEEVFEDLRMNIFSDQEQLNLNYKTKKMKVRVISARATDTLEEKINEFLDEQDVDVIDIKIAYNDDIKKMMALIQYREIPLGGAQL
ncbi:hypothetical protein SAMN05421827_109137 [Pedobacter terrae]|uniref:Uncharacterized protein n=1 Tax=Pedobacter terrae TaxID=405671 RepID=A0A1G7W7W5_9SPHI|nr:hypothetical protein [Pedobacter terrae]SDG68003.1 hypothetical protein SAMN05421827_109137 [Pedobacter terrae]